MRYIQEGRMSTAQLRSVILGTGSELPSKVVTNHDLEKMVDTSDEWITVRTGIKERRILEEGKGNADMACEAAKRALADADMVAADLDAIIMATVTADYQMPSSACVLEDKLGARGVFSFDVGAACSGFLNALAVADCFIRTGKIRNALVVGSDVLSRVLNWQDRGTCILFGDGAGAVVLSATDVMNTGIRSIRLYSDGSRQELIQVPSRVRPNPPPGPPQLQRLEYMRISGREVFRFAVTRMIELIHQAEIDCREMGINGPDVLIPHQVNQRIIDAALETTKFPPEKVMVNLDKYGNTSSASVPIALDEALRAEAKFFIASSVESGTSPARVRSKRDPIFAGENVVSIR
jgi:3-oxoacyl-[acyl-carrier-protein] synthase-3